MIAYILLGLVVVYLYLELQKTKEKVPQYRDIREKPWLISPWNQSTWALGHDEDRRGFEIDPHSWDVKNDPAYYRWLMHQKVGRYLPENN